ncbi:hypothetical protein CL634_06890 [bacterium]|nr:hypothetical protein [bacterium]|tara:strand:- start:1071 stop:1397 length:327 start_codon:yes stop_codon:yes gene_type:complete
MTTNDPSGQGYKKLQRHERVNEIFQQRKQIEQLKAENERFRKALEVIKKPQLNGCVYTSNEAMNKNHKERLLVYLNQPELIKSRGFEIVVGSFYALTTDVAKQVLEGE